MTQRYQPSGGFAFRVVADQGLFVPLRGGVADLQNLFTVNETGTEIWRDLQEGKSRDEIANRLVHRFEVDRDQALADFDGFMELLLGQGIVETTGPSEPRGSTA